MLVIQDRYGTRFLQTGDQIGQQDTILMSFTYLKDQQTTQYSVEIWKRFRKWGGVPTGISNVKDLLGSAEIENIFDNTDFVLMLNQASGDREILAKNLKFLLFN